MSFVARMYASVAKNMSHPGTGKRRGGRPPGVGNARITPSQAWFANALNKIIDIKKNGAWLGAAVDGPTRDRILWYLHLGGKHTSLLRRYDWDEFVNGHGKRRRRYNKKGDAIRMGDAERLLDAMAQDKEIGNVMPPWFYLIDTNFQFEVFRVVDQLTAVNKKLMGEYRDAIALEVHRHEEKALADVKTGIQSGIHGPKNGDDDDGGDG